MRFNKLNRFRLRADRKKLQDGDNAEPGYLCSGAGASFLMEFSPGLQRSRRDPPPLPDLAGSMVPIFWIVQQLFVFEQTQRIEPVVHQESSIESARINPGKTLRTFTGRQPLQNAASRDIHLGDSVVIHRAYESVMVIRNHDQPFRELARWNPANHTAFRGIKDYQFVAAGIGDPKRSCHQE